MDLPKRQEPSPASVKEVRGDGNCFFRTLSVSILGVQSHHLKVRTAVADHIAANEGNKFADYLHMDPAVYLNNSRMRTEKVYATDSEILAAASLFRCNIFVFDAASRHENRMWKCYNSLLETGDPCPGIPSLLIYHPPNHFQPIIV